MRRVNVLLRVTSFADHRGKSELMAEAAIEQKRQDLRLEQLWRERVRLNIQRRLARRAAALL